VGDAALRKRLAAEVGATRQVLIESDKQGRTEHFLPVAISGETPGAVLALAISGNDGARLLPSPLVGEGGVDAVHAG
jgi:threonylcarbamoyladenosine tRNA methylthiotransferase MtaB